MQVNKKILLPTITTAFIIISLSGFVSADTLRFEAEGGLLTGPMVKVSTDVSGYSGDGYVTGFRHVDPNDETVTVAVYAESSDDYPLTIGYRSPFSDKTNMILVNDIDIGYATFWVSEEFTELPIGDISLNAGINTVTFTAANGEGWMDVDYFQIEGLTRQAMDPLPRHRATASPTTTQLCWKNPDPGLGDIITCDVYFGTTEPDDQLPDYGLTKIASAMWGNCADIPYELNDSQVYYWIVDCWDYNSGSPILLRGGAWQFTTGISPTLLEAEDGLISGPEVTVSDYVEGFSGTGYVTGFNQIDRPNERATVSVYASTAGSYPLSIGYRSDYGEKTQYFYVNDVQLSNAVFPITDYWDVLEYGNIDLEQGVNTLTISTYWGYIYLDYFAIQGLDPAPFSPNPPHKATVGTDLAQLCWKNPDPGLGDTITCDVYFGQEPNELLPNYGLTQIAAGTEDTCVPIGTALDQFQDYYWLVNCWDSEGGSPVMLQGGLWTFKTGNAPPDPNAGPDIYTWLGKDGTPGQVTVNIDAIVTDDGLPSGTLIYSWTQTAGTLVTIDPDDTEDTSITFTEEGDYSFRLTVSDTELQALDNINIGVRSTPCDAAQADPWYWAYDGDLNADCYVNISDFELLAMDWMNCVDPEGCL